MLYEPDLRRMQEKDGGGLSVIRHRQHLPPPFTRPGSMYKNKPKPDRWLAYHLPCMQERDGGGDVFQI